MKHETWGTLLCDLVLIVFARLFRSVSWILIRVLPLWASVHPELHVVNKHRPCRRLSVLKLYLNKTRTLVLQFNSTCPCCFWAWLLLVLFSFVSQLQFKTENGEASFLNSWQWSLICIGCQGNYKFSAETTQLQWVLHPPCKWQNETHQAEIWVVKIGIFDFRTGTRKSVLMCFERKTDNSSLSVFWQTQTIYRSVTQIAK